MEIKAQVNFQETVRRMQAINFKLGNASMIQPT